MFRRLLKKQKRKLLLKNFRGYLRLKKAGKVELITDIKRALITSPLPLKSSLSDRLIFTTALNEKNFIVKQCLYHRLIPVWFPRFIYHSELSKDRKLTYPLPREWQNLTILSGKNVNKLFSTLLWLGVVILSWFYGQWVIAKIVFSSIREIISPQYREVSDETHFEQISSQNFPVEKGGGTSYDLISWYKKHKTPPGSEQSISHRVADVKVSKMKGLRLTYQQRPIKPLQSLTELASFLGWAMKASFLTLIDLLLGRWQGALLLNQAALAANARFINKEKLAKRYLFNNSSWIYRPLWSYEVEHKGAEVIFYFYSTNFEGFKLENGKVNNFIENNLMRWPTYWVWDKQQLEYITKLGNGPFNSEVVGPTWFADSSETLLQMSKQSIAIFDVQPVRLSFYYSLGIRFDYYTPKIATKFLADICEAAKATDQQLYWKRKREIGKLAHPKFIHASRDLLESNNIITVDPNISAHRLIKHSSYVVSMPYTSTALIARELGKPSCYYDASGLLQKNDTAAHGLPVIKSSEELIDWINNNPPKAI